MSASDQLERILYVLPMAARPGGVTFDELTRALHTDRETIVADLGEATARAYYHPAGSVDPFEISIETDRVRVHAPNEFKRPVRLNQREALALGLGLRVLASEAQGDRRKQILELAARLEQDLATPPLRLQPSMIVAESLPEYEPQFEVAVGEDDLRNVFAEAIEESRICVIEYMKPHAAPSLREVLPQRLIYGNGHWYVAGIDLAVKESRVFRLDRVISAEATQQRLPKEHVAEQMSFYVGHEQDEREVRVRYSKQVARWIAEQNGGACEPDGSIVVTHRVSDDDWLVRHVLQYGGEAVVETPELRRVVAEKAAALCA